MTVIACVLTLFQSLCILSKLVAVLYDLKPGLGGCRNWLQPGLYWVVDYRNLGLQQAGCSIGAKVATYVPCCNPPYFWGVATICATQYARAARLCIKI